jgi:hypothetical protein
VAPSDRGDPDDSGLGLPIGLGEDAQQELPEEIDEGEYDEERMMQLAAGDEGLRAAAAAAAEDSGSDLTSDEDAGEKVQQKGKQKAKQQAKQKAQKTQQSQQTQQTQLTPEKAAAGGKGKGKGSPAPATPPKEAATPKPAGEKDHFSKTEIEEYVDKKPRKVPFSKLEWDKNRVYGQPRALKYKIWNKYYMDLVGAGAAPRQPISNVIGYQRDGMQPPPKPETTLPPTQPTTT